MSSSGLALMYCNFNFTLKKLCKTQHACVIVQTFSGDRLLTFGNTLKRLDKIPKAFSTTLRTLLNLYVIKNALLSCHISVRVWFHDVRRQWKYSICDNNKWYIFFLWGNGRSSGRFREFISNASFRVLCLNTPPSDILYHSCQCLRKEIYNRHQPFQAIHTYTLCCFL